MGDPVKRYDFESDDACSGEYNCGVHEVEVEDGDFVYFAAFDAEVRERERAAFVACAKAIMSPLWCLPVGKGTIEWAEAEAIRRYGGEA